MLFDHAAFAALVKRKRGETRLSQANLASDVFGDEARKSDISRIEAGKSTPQEQTVQKLVRALGISEAEMATIRRGLNTDQQLDALPSLSRAELVNLAYRFQISDADDHSDLVLRSELTSRAEEYRSLKRELQAVRKAIPRLENVMKEALALLELGSVQAGKVREMIAEARKSWHNSVLRDALEQDAQLAEAQARAALMDNDSESAFHILSATADSFSTLDALEPARRRERYAALLYTYGVRVGGTGLPLAIQMHQDNLTWLEKCTDPALRAEVNVDFAQALLMQGIRTLGLESDGLLAASVSASDAALFHYRGETDSPQWKRATIIKVSALRAQANRATEPHRTRIWRQLTELNFELCTKIGATDIVESHKEAAIRSEVDAAAFDALVALENFTLDVKKGVIGDRVRTGGVSFLDTQALPIIELVALTHLLLAGLQDQSEGFGSLIRGYTICKAKFESINRATQPIEWASAHQALGRLKLAKAQNLNCTDPVVQLRSALAHVDLSVDVYDPTHMASEHQKATELRKYILTALCKATPLA